MRQPDRILTPMAATATPTHPPRRLPTGWDAGVVGWWWCWWWLGRSDRSPVNGASCYLWAAAAAPLAEASCSRRCARRPHSGHVDMQSLGASEVFAVWVTTRLNRWRTPPFDGECFLFFPFCHKSQAVDSVTQWVHSKKGALRRSRPARFYF